MASGWPSAPELVAPTSFPRALLSSTEKRHGFLLHDMRQRLFDVGKSWHSVVVARDIARRLEHREAKWVIEYVPALMEGTSRSEMTDFFRAIMDDHPEVSYSSSFSFSLFFFFCLKDDIARCYYGCMRGRREWISEAAEMGNAYAQALMIKIKEDASGFELAARSSLQGDALGAYVMYVCHFDGIGTDKNFGKAFEWLQKAADRGCVVAVMRMAELSTSLVERIMLRCQILQFRETQGMAADVGQALGNLRVLPGMEESIFESGSAMRGTLANTLCLVGAGWARISRQP